MGFRTSHFARSVAPLCALALVSLGAGCAAKNNGESVSAQDEADSTDANASSAQSSHFTEMFAGSVSAGGAQAAADANVVVNEGWPLGCATRPKDPNDPLSVIGTMNGCTGPFGLVHVSGQLVATFSTSASGALHIAVTSKNLTANGRPVTESGEGDVTVSGSKRVVAWKGEWTRENLLGETVTHTNDATVTIDTTTWCRTVDGTAETSVGARQIASAVKGYTLCREPDGDGCPSGEITHTRVSTGATLTIDFNGTAEAKVIGPHGYSVEVPLVCTAS
jgi:hypothetical protein